MQVITGTKRDVTIMEHTEQLEKDIKNLNDSMECFRKFKGTDDLDRLIGHCNSLIKKATSAKEAIEFMDQNNIR